MNSRLQAYLRLTRPPNLLTAVSDIWAGAALSGYFLMKGYAVWPVVLLSISSILLYAGGVVMNDVYDADLDAIERPERPIPSGIVSRTSAAFLGVTLLLLGIILASFNGLLSGSLAFLIAAACLLYDSKAKHHAFFGPLNMGICRGLNLLLGMSILPMFYHSLAWFAIVPVIYIAAVTLVSRGEVQGGERFPILMAMVMYGLVLAVVLLTGIFMYRLAPTLVFLALFAVFIYPPLYRAWKKPVSQNIGRAVKSGVLGLILMNTAWVAAGSGWSWALITALLLPLSIGIARRFAVT